MKIKKIKILLLSRKDIIDNTIYISLLQLFIIVAPLITYSYLIRVLGGELYGVVLSSQMLVSYASILIDFGSNNVCAKHVSVNRTNLDKLSEILSSVLLIRLFLFAIVFLIYMAIVFAIPTYKEYSLLFFLTFFLTLNDVLFPQFFFQGIEKMKYVSLINIGIKLFFILLVFLCIKEKGDYLLIPILYSIGYILGGISSLWIIRYRLKIKFRIPAYKEAIVYAKDSSAIFATELISTIKDKLNYLFVGMFVSMNSVVVYDLSLKINSFLTKPLNVISIVLFPRFAKNRNLKALKKVIIISFLLTAFLVLFVNLFLSKIVSLFINDNIDLLPVRLFLLAPLMLSVSSMISTNLFIAFGYNKYILYSIIITTGVYVLALCYIFFSEFQNNLYSYIVLAIVSYSTEFIYRLWKAAGIYSKYNN